jgi:thiamine pyrophosphate-dependent acetolactate synthase large subunit-like protein
MSLARLATELNGAIDDDTVLVEHATTSTGMLMAYLRLPKPTNVFGTGASVQGWGMPASIGVQMGRPGQPVLAIVGDGGFTFTCQSLWTAAKYSVPVTILVLNNRGYRSMRGGMARGAPKAHEAGLDFGFDFEIGIHDVARGFGVECKRVADPAELADAVHKSLGEKKPQVIEAMISPALTFRPSKTTPVAL